VPALDVARFVQPFPKSRQEGCLALTRTEAEISDHRHCRLLRACSQRPCDCGTADERDEVAAPHSITSSARASKGGGTSMPGDFAVLRLMTSSYLVGACTARSAGFPPFNIRLT